MSELPQYDQDSIRCRVQMPELLYIDSDILIELAEVRSRLTGEYLDGLTLRGSLQTMTGGPVFGGNAVAFESLGSGRYAGKIGAFVRFTAGQEYILVVQLISEDGDARMILHERLRAEMQAA